MKSFLRRGLIVLGCIFLMSQILNAAGPPHLTCDAYTPTTLNGDPLVFELSFDGGAQVSCPQIVAPTNPNALVIWYDLGTSNITEGTHKVVARAKFGTLTSANSNELTFTKKFPLSPNGMGISPN